MSTQPTPTTSGSADASAGTESEGPPGSTPKVATVRYQLGYVISGNPIAEDTSAAPALNEYVAITLQVPVPVARHVAWLLLQRAVQTRDPEGAHRRPFAAARYLLDLVRYAEKDGKVDREAVLEGDTVSLKTLQSWKSGEAGDLDREQRKNFPGFYRFEPPGLVRQRQLIAARVGGWTKTQPTGVAPRPREHKAPLKELCEAVWSVMRTDLLDPDVVQPMILEAQNELDAEMVEVVNSGIRGPGRVAEFEEVHAAAPDAAEATPRGEIADLAANTDPSVEPARDGSIFDRFTEEARRAVVTAQAEARALGHSFIGAEHLVLGAIAEAEGDLADRLDRLGVSVEKSRDLVQEHIGQGTSSPADDSHLAFAPHAKDAIQAAIVEAFGRNSQVVTVSHLLLGLMSVDGIAPLLLRRQVDDHAIEIVRAQLGMADE